MVNAFSNFMDARPAMDSSGSEQIDLISVSCWLAQYIDKAYILAPSDSKGDH
jgi:hypothetical protein